MPDLVPGATNARIAGSYGTGPNGTTACNLGIGSGCTAIRYIDPSKFQAPQNISALAATPQYLIGNTPRTQALNLRNPGTQNLDMSLHRTFALPKEFGTFMLEVDCLNVWNKVTFSAPGAAWNATLAGGNVTGYTGNFGQITGIANSPRDFQFAGHFNF
jgi:hypothetical protein